MYTICNSLFDYLGSVNLEFNSQLFLYNKDMTQRRLIKELGAVDFLHPFEKFNLGQALMFNSWG
jgi:hypothetical protein